MYFFLAIKERELTDRRVLAGLVRQWIRVESEPNHDQSLDEAHRVEPLASSPTIGVIKMTK